MADRDDTNFDLPQPVQDALRGLYAPPPVPPELDERVLLLARQAFARRMRTRMILRRTAAVGGAVAAAVALFFGVQAMRPGETATPQVAVLDGSRAVGDVDGSGRVDIVDALALAKRVEAGDAASPAWEDLDRDGKVTRADVEQVAQLAVKLPDSDFAGGARLQ